MFKIQGVHFLLNIHLFTKTWVALGVQTFCCLWGEEGREKTRLRDGSGEKAEHELDPADWGAGDGLYWCKATIHFCFLLCVQSHFVCCQDSWHHRHGKHHNHSFLPNAFGDLVSQHTSWTSFSRWETEAERGRVFFLSLLYYTSTLFGTL